MIVPSNNEHPRFEAPLSNNNPTPPSMPQNYRPTLTPTPSSLRPHCLARDRLRLWLPPGENARKRTSTNSNNHSTNEITISDAQLNRILEVMGSSWATSTKETYGAGLLVFHVYCDLHHVPEEQRCPISSNLLLMFLSSCAGSYSGSSLNNYTAALKAWHSLHGQPWLVQTSELKTILDGATALAPPSSKRAKRTPFTLAILTSIREHLDLDDPRDAAIFACITTTFYSIARLGEFTVPAMKDFDPAKHITRGGVAEGKDRNSLPVTIFHLPRTKSSPIKGEDAYWAAQVGPSDPKAALENHLHVNPAENSAHLFAWKHPKGLRPLTKSELTKRLASISSIANIPNLKGHSIRIGGTLEYLLRGIPFDVVKTMGRWSSEAFTLYLRQHALVMAPYIQATPALEPFTRYTMPPVR